MRYPQVTLGIPSLVPGLLLSLKWGAPNKMLGRKLGMRLYYNTSPMITSKIHNQLKDNCRNRELAWYVVQCSRAREPSLLTLFS